MDKIEFRVIPVKRFVVTRYHADDGVGGVESLGEFDNADIGYLVAYALCKDEHSRLGWPIGDERITYPTHPNAADVAS